MKKIEIIEKETKEKKIPDFRVGDTLKVYIKVKEGDKTRTQLFEGTCIRRRGSGSGKSFTVLKDTHGEKVEKIFPLYTPTIEKISVSRKRKVKKAKLYHLRKK